MPGLFATAKAYWEGWKFKRSTLGRALAAHTQTYFYSGVVLSHLSQTDKDKVIGDLYQKLAQISSAADPAMELRTLLAEYVLVLADLSVLALTEVEKADTEYGRSPYISGELYHHVLEAVPHCEDLAKLNDDKATAEKLIGFCNRRSALMLYFANGLNMARVEMGDGAASPKDDWYKPFVEAAMVTSEHRFREKLGLPLLMKEPITALAYSTYLNAVLNGERNPFDVWTKQYPKLYLAGRGPMSAAT